MDITSILHELNRINSPSGEEVQIAEKIKEFAAPFADSVETDVMGNLIVHKKGPGRKIMVTGHMDTIGLMITHIDEKGFLRFGAIGGVDAKDLVHTPVRFKSGLQGIIGLEEKKVEGKKITINDLYIDIGVSSEKEAKRYVKVGDTAVYLGRMFTISDKIIGPYLDNRASCAVMLYVLSKLKNKGNDVYFVFTAQEEVGMRGAKTVAYSVMPEYGIVMDVTECCDTPGSLMEGTTKLGDGAGIKVMDHSVICTPKVVKLFEKLAKANRIKHQKDIMADGGTDGGPIHTTGTGIMTGGLSVPCRYIHSPTEMISSHDAEDVADLLLAFLENDFDQE